MTTGVTVDIVPSSATARQAVGAGAVEEVSARRTTFGTALIGHDSNKRTESSDKGEVIVFSDKWGRVPVVHKQKGEQGSLLCMCV